VPKLLMRAAASNFGKAQLPEARDDLARLQNRHFAHKSRHFDGLRSDEHAVEPRVAFFEQQCDDFLQIGPQFVQRRALAVRAGKSGHPADVQPGVGIFFDDCGKALHDDASLMSDLLMATSLFGMVSFEGNYSLLSSRSWIARDPGWLEPREPLLA
jgi:hypothetical protein